MKKPSWKPADGGGGVGGAAGVWPAACARASVESVSMNPVAAATVRNEPIHVSPQACAHPEAAHANPWTIGCARNSADDQRGKRLKGKTVGWKEIAFTSPSSARYTRIDTWSTPRRGDNRSKRRSSQNAFSAGVGRLSNMSN